MPLPNALFPPFFNRRVFQESRVILDGRDFCAAKGLLSLAVCVCFCLSAMRGAGADENNAAGSDGDEKKPNILYIMSDDHTSTGIGCYGSRLAYLNPTPNIDRLATEGVRLANCFCTNSICTPSRATILSGQYSHVNGVTTLIQPLDIRKHTVPRLIKQAGYETAMIGKWHLKVEPELFDFYTVLPGQGWYHNPEFRVRGPKPWPKNTMRIHKHSSDAVTDISLKWLKTRKQKNKPFFLMHHFKAPHDDFENAERYDFLYQNETIPEPKSLRDRGQHGPVGKDSFGTSVSNRNKRRNMGMHMFVDQTLDDDQYTTESYQRYIKKFLRTVKGVDDNVGRLLAHLKATGELDNTIIIYTADQGFMLGEHDYIDKRWMYEESLRMPFLVRYPKQFKAGTVNEDIINNVDFCPTLLEMAGADKFIEQLEPDQALQGRSFVSNLTGDTPEDWPKSSYYRYWMHMAHHDNPAHFGIRNQQFKLIFFYGRKLKEEWYYNPDRVSDTEPFWELYDIQNDPKEMKNLIDDPAYAQKFKELKADLYAARVKAGDTDAKFPDVQKLFETVTPPAMK
jgi:arylsulfatase A-like enzyme